MSARRWSVGRAQTTAKSVESVGKRQCESSRRVNAANVCSSGTSSPKSVNESEPISRTVSARRVYAVRGWMYRKQAQMSSAGRIQRAPASSGTRAKL